VNDDKTRVVTKASAVEIGTELNQTYKIDALIGIGGMGEVFKGHNIQTGDPVAIKVVLPEFARDEMIFELFRKEARVLNHLAHDAIVRYYVFSLDRVIGRHYLAMEYVDGPSLAASIKIKPLPPEKFFGLLRRLADGLHKAHEAGVIHRDISPDNVILPDGSVERAKIIDFGIAKAADVGGGTILGGSFAGKYSYVSPEQLGLFGADVTPKSDIYSLGLMMAAAVRGQPLDMSGSQFEVIEKRRSVPRLSDAGIPKQFHAILTAMLQPNPADRPASMAAVRDMLDQGQSANASQASNQKSGSIRNAAVGVALTAIAATAGWAGWNYAQSHKTQVVEQTETPAVNLPKASAPTPSLNNQPPVASAQPQTQTPDAKPKDSVPAIAEPPKREEPKVAVVPNLVTPPLQPVTPTAEFNLAALRNFIQTNENGSCLRVRIDEFTAKSAHLSALGTPEAVSKFERQFLDKVGYSPQISLGSLTAPQCTLIEALNTGAQKNGAPLTIKLNSNDIRASNADTGVAGDSLVINLSGIADRNIYLFVVDHEGGIQNLNRTCPSCITIKDGGLNAKLSLFSPAVIASQSPPPFYPMLVFVAAASKPLNDLNAQDAFDANDFTDPLMKAAASADDFSTQVAYFKLKSK